MKVVLSGGTGVIGRAALPALLAAGHEVVVLTRSDTNDRYVASLGATAVRADLFDVDSLSAAYDGADAVINLATHIPVGYAAALPGAWRRNDELRTQGVTNVVDAALRAGVRRVVQESVSFVYADGHDEWLDEQSPLAITQATEPAAVGESRVQDYTCDSRAGVVLRFGLIIGDDPMTRYWLRAAAHGRPVGMGSPKAWRHVVHTDDLGSAVVAGLSAPAGVYNVGAEPVLAGEVVEGYADYLGLEQANFMGPLLRFFAGARVEPLTRSLRISGNQFATATGWRPSRAVFKPDWFVASDG